MTTVEIQLTLLWGKSYKQIYSTVYLQMHMKAQKWKKKKKASKDLKDVKVKQGHGRNINTTQISSHGCSQVAKCPARRGPAGGSGRARRQAEQCIDGAAGLAQ